MKPEINKLISEFIESISPKKHNGIFKIPLIPANKAEENRIESILKSGDFTHEDMRKLYILMKETAVIHMMSAISEIQRTKAHNIPLKENTRIISPFSQELLENKNKTLIAKSISDGSKGGHISAEIKKKRQEPLKQEFEKWKIGGRTVKGRDGKPLKYEDYGGKTAFDLAMVEEGKAPSQESARKTREKIGKK